MLQSQRYPRGLCKEICQGLLKQKTMDYTGLAQIMNVTRDDNHNNNEPPPPHDEDDDDIGDDYAFDDVSGKALDPKAVKRAREEEMQ